jgi:hypothetical protein
MSTFAGCLGGVSVEWGTGNGEYSTHINSNGMNGSITNKLSSGSALERDYSIAGCNEDGDKISISGWLVQTNTFESPPSGGYPAVTSWIMKEMSYNSAQDVDPGSIHVSIANRDNDWQMPTYAEVIPYVDGNQVSSDKGSFPQKNWVLVGIVPANENVLHAAMNMDTNQAVQLKGYMLGGDNMGAPSGYTLDGCSLDAAPPGCSADPCGWNGNFVVTSIKHGSSERVIDSQNEYVMGDVPIFGRTIYTIIILLSIVGAGAMFIFSRNMIMQSADERAQTMLSDDQMRAGKTAVHEAARHEARVKAQAAALKAEAKGKKRKPKAGDVPKFDVDAALAEDSPDASTGHFVAGTGATVTEEAKHMDEQISEMQEELELEMKFKEKGLRGLVGNIDSSGSQRRGRVTGGVSSTQTSTPKKSSSPETKAEAPKTRKTRKTKKSEPEPEEETVERHGTEVDGPDIIDDDDFGDFSF